MNEEGYVEQGDCVEQGHYVEQGEFMESIEGGGAPPIYHMTLDNIKQIINQNLPINIEKKNASGEVFTPLFLIEDMLGTLPTHLWKDPTLKWLEPANGIGGFSMVVYLLLMERLPDSYHNAGISYSSKYGKSKHVLKNMLYMVEMDRENVIASRKIFGKDANIIHANFVAGKPTVSPTFDIIFGNPPYNEGGVMKGGGILWKDFVLKSIDLLSPNGYLLFVHPTGWRKPAGDRASTGDIWTLFRRYHLVFLKMSDEEIPHFPRVDYYVLHKSPEMREKNTHVVCKFEDNHYDGMLPLYELDFIPHFVNERVLRILQKVFTKSGDKFDIMRDRSFEPSTKDMDTHKNRGIPYTFYYEPECRDYVYAYNTDETESPDYIKQKKIILTHTRGKHAGELYPVYYSESAKVGSSSNTMYQLIRQGDRVKPLMAFFKSRLVDFIMRITQYSETPNHKNEYKILNKIAKPTTETDIYTYYSINKTEIRMIDRVLGKPRVPVKSRKLYCRQRKTKKTEKR